MDEGLTYCPRCLRVLCVCAGAGARAWPREARILGACGGEAREADGRRHPEPIVAPGPDRAA